MVLGMFPDWFGPPQPDWPPNTRLVGFPLWDATTETDLSAEVREFLAAGDAPIAFSPGSANRAGASILRRGRRGVRADRSARHFAHEVRRAIAGKSAAIGATFRLRAAQSAAAAHGGARASRRHRHLCAGTGGRRAAAGAADGVRSVRQFAAAGAAGRGGRDFGEAHFAARRSRHRSSGCFESPTVAANCRDLAARCDGPASLTAACVELEQLVERAGGAVEVVSR